MRRMTKRWVKTKLVSTMTKKEKASTKMMKSLRIKQANLQTLFQSTNKSRNPKELKKLTGTT